MKSGFFTLVVFCVATLVHSETVSWPFPIVESNFRVAPLTGQKYDISKKDEIIMAPVVIKESIVDDSKKLVFTRQVIKSMKERESDTGSCSIPLGETLNIIESLEKAHLKVQFVGSDYFELQPKHVRYFQDIMTRIKLRNKLEKVAGSK